MSTYFSKFLPTSQKALAILVMLAILASALPTQVLAETNASSSDETGAEAAPLVEESATTTPSETETTETATTTDETASTTDETATADTAATSSATSTEETSAPDGANGTPGPQTENGTDATTTATTTEGATDGSEGESGESGSGGENPESTASTTDPDLVAEPLPVVTDALIGDTDSPETEDITGGITPRRSDNVSIATGRATAQGEIFNQGNTTNVRSIYNPNDSHDLDTYTFNLSTTDTAPVSNNVAAIALSGENNVDASGVGSISTGDAIAAFNIANVINSNIVNSDGYMYLASQIMNPNTSLNLSDFFFPEGDSILAAANDCNLNSCHAEDIVYNISQMNHATITNDTYIEAISGNNSIDADRANLTTGDAYGTANVINVVNTNIVDSQYRLLTFNAVGDLDGNLVLPTQQLFDAFFGKPNGLNQLEQPEEANINVTNTNDAIVNNNVRTYAESGLNNVTAVDSDTVTGNSEAESNVLNRVNQNIYGGDVMYLWIRVHGSWSGDVVGLPDGLTWQWTPDGVIIYNEDAEITPSELLGIDIDSYTANITNQSSVVIDNNINIDAITGENRVDGWRGDTLVSRVDTGDAYASANVMNIANTNVIGANWMMAVINVMGDFDGNVTFTETDLSLTGSGVGANDPALPGDALTFTYTIANSSDAVATDVTLRHALVNAHVAGTESDTVQTVSLGTIAPGATRTVNLLANVDTDFPDSSSTVRAAARVLSAQGDRNPIDNTVVVSLAAAPLTDSDPDDDNATTTDDSGEDTPTDDTTDQTDNGGAVDPSPSSSSGGGGGGGGGGGSSNKTKSIEREQKEVDPNAPPFIVLQKKAVDIDEDDVVTAGSSVDYVITLTNTGGTAYDATVYDTLKNPVDAVLNEQSWDLGTILPGEVIDIEYTTTYDSKTPTGTYTNTASIDVYRHADTKENGERPLKLDDAVHTIEIEGVALGIGNVKAIAYYPNGSGGINALVSWETSKPATGQILYSPKLFASVYDSRLANFGYHQASFKFETPKTKHHMIIRNLLPGVEYTYKIRSTRGSDVAVGGDYTLFVPVQVQTIALALPNGKVAQIAGAAISVPTPTPTPYVPAPSRIPTPPTSVPAPEEVTESEPTPEQSSDTANESSGGFLNRVFGFFR